MSIKAFTTGLLASSLALPLALVSVPIAGIDRVCYVPNAIGGRARSFNGRRADGSLDIAVDG